MTLPHLVFFFLNCHMIFHFGQPDNEKQNFGKKCNFSKIVFVPSSRTHIHKNKVISSQKNLEFFFLKLAMEKFLLRQKKQLANFSLVSTFLLKNTFEIS